MVFGFWVNPITIIVINFFWVKSLKFGPIFQKKKFAFSVTIFYCCALACWNRYHFCSTRYWLSFDSFKPFLSELSKILELIFWPIHLSQIKNGVSRKKKIFFLTKKTHFLTLFLPFSLIFMHSSMSKLHVKNIFGSI